MVREIADITVTVHIDMLELTVRMIEAQTAQTRPTPLAADALAMLPPALAQAWMRAAKVAVRFMAEAMESTPHPDTPLN